MTTINGTWAAWVEEYYAPLLVRATALFNGRSERAADFLHELLLELRQKWDTIEHPLGWISNTMRHRIVDYLRKGNEVLPENVVDARSTDPGLQMDIQDALDRLPGGLHEVLALFLEGNSIVEISERTKLSADAVYQRLSRARKQLKKNLGADFHGKQVQRLPDEAATFPI